MCKGIFSVVFGVLVAFGVGTRCAHAEVTGDVVKLSEQTDPQPGPLVVNRGGLVIVVVGDRGSRPPENIKVDFGDGFEKIGRARGSQTDWGEFMFGGGYTYVLLTPTKAGKQKVTVRFTDNDEERTEVKREYLVKVRK